MQPCAPLYPRSKESHSAESLTRWRSVCGAGLIKAGLSMGFVSQTGRAAGAARRPGGSKRANEVPFMMGMMGIDGDVLPGSGESGGTHGPTHFLFLSDTFIA